MEYKHFGVMLDCSRNAVIKVEQMKRLIDVLSKIGYDSIELYTEDTYEIEGEPYFGYMRGRYTGEELREMDAYAKAHGVELIPCIQTLAHLEGIFRHREYEQICDTGNILLVEEERTYDLIDKMFATLAKNFSSRLVNIGMDEAHMVGCGRYLDKHGYTNRFELLSRHLKKVLEIAQKYGFKVHMWSDMFFRFVNNGMYRVDENFVVPKEMTELIPDDVELVFWDYYHKHKKEYDNNLSAHKKIGKPVWFAGGAWTWNGFAPSNRFSMLTMKGAMESVREFGIENVMLTMWKDNGGECSFFSVLPSLYAIRQYADGNFDEDKIAAGFEKIFGISFDDFMTLDLPNDEGAPFGYPYKQDPCSFKVPLRLDPFGGYPHQQNPSKVLLYSDPFMGIKDDQYAKQEDIDWQGYSARLDAVSKKAGEYAYLFETMKKLCDVLAYKARMGVKARAAYEKKDMGALNALVEDCDRAIVNLHAFHETFYELWKKENKPFGWEIQDTRLGGLIKRLETCQKRLKEYLAGETDKIDELEEKLLPMEEWWYLWCATYLHIISWNRM